VCLSSGAAFPACVLDETRTGSTSARIEALAACVSAQEDEIKTLKASLANIVPAIGGHEKTKAIVAYFSDKGQKTCPDGWSPFEEAKDRVIIGASFKYPQVGMLGGEESVTLGEAEMPMHSHAHPDYGYTLAISGTGTTTAIDEDASLRQPNLLSANLLETRGDNQPHNNMPPYIALYFCKKD